MDRLKLAIQNVWGREKKQEALNRALKTTRINITVIIETKNKLKGTKELDDCIMVYIGVDVSIRARCGIPACGREIKFDS